MSVNPGERYRHYKGGEYTVLHLAYREEDLEPVVVYQAEYETKDLGSRPIFTRLLTSFCSEVEVGGASEKRFKLI